MADPAVSVLMPVLSPHPGYFPAAVRSVLAQTMGDLELVIVEDPSQSDGRELLGDLADPRIRYIRNESRTSLVDQRNRALAEARGELVAMLDADDLAEPHRLATQIAFLKAHPDIGVLGSALSIIDENGRRMGVRSYPQAHASIVTAMARFNAIAQPSVLARKHVLLDAGGYQYREYPVNEDYELWSRLERRGVRFANHPDRLVQYRVHSHGTKAAMLHRMLRATIDVKQRWWLDRMDARARLRFLGEHVLLGLPESWVLRLFVFIQYERESR